VDRKFWQAPAVVQNAADIPTLALWRLTGCNAQKKMVTSTSIAARADLPRQILAGNTGARTTKSGRKVCASVQCS